MPNTALDFNAAASQAMVKEKATFLTSLETHYQVVWTVKAARIQGTVSVMRMTSSIHAVVAVLMENTTAVELMILQNAKEVEDPSVTETEVANPAAVQVPVELVAENKVKKLLLAEILVAAKVVEIFLDLMDHNLVLDQVPIPENPVALMMTMLQDTQDQEKEVDLVQILLIENHPMKELLTTTPLAKDLNLLKAEKALKMVKEGPEISVMTIHLDFAKVPNLEMAGKVPVPWVPAQVPVIWLMKTKFNLERVPETIEKDLEPEDPEDLVILVMITLHHGKDQKMDPGEIQVIFLVIIAEKDPVEFQGIMVIMIQMIQIPHQEKDLGMIPVILAIVPVMTLLILIVGKDQDLTPMILMLHQEKDQNLIQIILMVEGDQEDLTPMIQMLHQEKDPDLILMTLTIAKDQVVVQMTPIIAGAQNLILTIPMLH
jgi:hypothetical protein